MASSSDEEFDDVKTKSTILDKLAQYGDSLLDNDTNTTKKSKKEKKKSSTANITSGNQNTAKKRKKKKRKSAKAPSDTDDLGSRDNDHGEGHDLELHGEQLQLEQLKEKLGLTDPEFLRSHHRKKQQQESQTQAKTAPKVTNGSAKGKRGLPEVIVFEDPAKRNKNKPKKQLPPHLTQRRKRTTSTDSEMASDDDFDSPPKKKKPKELNPQTDENLFDMRRAKHDVQMFGITGMEKSSKEKARRDVLYKLGAKQKKNEYVNYKKYQEMKKQEKQEEEVKRQIDRAVGNRVSKANNRKQRARDQNDVGAIDGQIGKYKSGVQVINKREIHKVKTSGGHRRRR